MKVEDIEKQIAELQKKKERMLKMREYQKNFKNKKSGKMFALELKAEGDGRICEGANLQDILLEIKHHIQKGLFEQDDIYIIKKNGEIIAEYNYEQAYRLFLQN